MPHASLPLPPSEHGVDLTVKATHPKRGVEHNQIFNRTPFPPVLTSLV